SFTDFIALYPNDERVAEAQKRIIDLYRVQAAGSYRIARYYEKRRRYDGALIYYNEVVDLYTRFINEPAAAVAEEARQRITQLSATRSRVQMPELPPPTPAASATNAPAAPTAPPARP
ncbi:MAG: outer membrane protein assembly factor BamD, partial [Verrucomicrobiales bacterium]|nr:outer membrane protein assembly factor BamD [Verrucomicrobiales bacterium]